MLVAPVETPPYYGNDVDIVCFPWLQEIGPGVVVPVTPEAILGSEFDPNAPFPLPTAADIRIEAVRSAGLAPLPVARKPVGERFIVSMVVDMGGFRFESGTTLFNQPTPAVMGLMNRLRECIINGKAAGIATAQLDFEKEPLDAEFGGELPDIIAVRLGLDPDDPGKITYLTGLIIYDKEGETTWTGEGCMSAPRPISATCPAPRWCKAKGYELIPTKLDSDGKIIEARIAEWGPYRFENQAYLLDYRVTVSQLGHERRHNDNPEQLCVDLGYASAEEDAAEMDPEQQALFLRGDCAVGWMPDHLREVCIAQRTAIRAYKRIPSRATYQGLKEAARQYTFIPVPKPLYDRMCNGLRMPTLAEIQDVEASRS